MDRWNNRHIARRTERKTDSARISRWISEWIRYRYDWTDMQVDHDLCMDVQEDGLTDRLKDVDMD